MTKRYDDPIDVTQDPAQNGAPISFSWRGRRYEVDQWLMTWREAGEWWRRKDTSTNGGASTSSTSENGSTSENDSTSENGSNGRAAASNGMREREFYRVLARPSGAFATGDLDADGFMQHAGAVYDVYLDRVRREWRLARVWD